MQEQMKVKVLRPFLHLGSMVDKGRVLTVDLPTAYSWIEHELAVEVSAKPRKAKGNP